MPCFVQLLKFVFLLGSSYVVYIETVFLEDYFKQHNWIQLSNIFETYQGLSDISCARKCQSRRISHRCFGANYNKQTRECGLSNDVTQRLMDTISEHLVAIITVQWCNDDMYLVWGTDGSKNAVVSASSYHAVVKTTDPMWARLNQTETEKGLGTGAGAWSAGYNQLNEWIGAEFPQLKVIQGVATQGRDSPLYTQYITHYTVSYSTDCEQFRPITDAEGSTVTFVGNTDTTSIITNRFPEKVVALCVRIHPTQWVGHISMRMDIIGCK